MHQSEVVEEVMCQDGLYASDDAQATLSQTQWVEHTRCVLIISTTTCTLCQDITQDLFRSVGYLVSACQQVYHVLAEEPLIHLVNLWLLAIVWSFHFEV